MRSSMYNDRAVFWEGPGVCAMSYLLFLDIYVSRRRREAYEEFGDGEVIYIYPDRTTPVIFVCAEEFVTAA